jgi:phosphate-selective porin OprO and OprP
MIGVHSDMANRSFSEFDVHFRIRRSGTWWAFILGMCSVLFALPPIAASQDLPPALPPGTAGPGPGDTPAATPRTALSVEQLAERLRAMEDLNRKLVERLEQSNRAHDEQMKQLLSRFGRLSDQLNGGQPPAATDGAIASDMAPLPDDGTALDDGTPVPDYTEGHFFPDMPAPGYPVSNMYTDSRLPSLGRFKGFQFKTEDEEFGIGFHLESQIDARVWSQRDQVPANSGLFLPRQRIYFDGNITKRIEYEFSINRGLGGTVNILNAYVNLHLDDRFELKIGRFFTPLTYDQFAIPNFWLPTPERSLFTNNVGLGRQIGLMGWGYLFDKRLDYAAGIFNGSRNSFESLSNGMDFVAYLNARPFQESESLGFARFLNMGTSVAIGHQNQPAVPVSFGIGGTAPNADVPGVGTTPFLILNPNVIERGDRLLGSVHSAYFYRGLSLIGEWQYGYGSYASLARSTQAQVPFAGFYVAGGYFLTGEHVDQRTKVHPLRPLVPTRKGDPMGPGALEVVSRVSGLRLGEKIFTAGFADPNLWSNQAVTTELGVNWYWNEYVKLEAFWLHAGFADPVQFRPGGLQKSDDMLWLRFQLYF